MSNIEVDSSDEEYYPSSVRNRYSCPANKHNFSAHANSDKQIAENQSQGSFKKIKKEGQKSKNGKPSQNVNFGRWSDEEHKKFLEAIVIYGRDWKKVQGYVGTRTSTQARSHAQKVLPQGSFVEGVSTLTHSASTGLTKSNCQNTNDATPKFDKTQSIVSEECRSEYAIFKVERMKK
uniref:Uncharacterized protein n=1 Tax=Euplotes harpa TaxID=151035 RepID=A0A7S3JFE6_9SPIT